MERDVDISVPAGDRRSAVDRRMRSVSPGGRCGAGRATATGVTDRKFDSKRAGVREKLPLADNCADVVTAFDSLEHLLPDEVDAVLDEIARILKPGGTFIASICYHPSRIKVEGEGLHPTVQPEEWWMAKLARFGEVRRAGRYLCAGA